MQRHNETRRPGGLLHPAGRPTPCAADKHCIRQRIAIYLRLLETCNESTRNITEPRHGISSTDRRTIRTSQCRPRTIPTSILQFQQDDWEKLLPIAEFCYNNMQVGSTKVTPFFANYGYHSRFLPDLSTQNEETPEVSEYATALGRLHEELRAEMKEAQMAQTEQANRARHPDPIMEPGDRVWLKRKNIRTTRPSNKLDHKKIGPYTILEKVGSCAYKLDLPASVKLHPVFHISLLEPTASTEPIPGHHQPPPPPIIIEEQQE